MDKVRERTGLYHEHQQGFLCAQHALNNLLQEEVFLADTLAEIARALDAEEKRVLNNASRISENVDDTGFFNIQVLQRALETYNLELVPFNSQDKVAVQARNYPESVRAYICNLGAHWFAIRRFAQHYFNLNSTQYVPWIMPIQILKKYLNMIETNGYSVFIVSGQLPTSLADAQLEINPISQMEYERLIKDLPKYIIDGKPVNDLKGFPTGDSMTAAIPHDVIEKYQKNPNDPQIQKLINSYLPDGMVVQGYQESGTCSCPGHRHTKSQLLVGRVPHNYQCEKSKSTDVSTKPEKQDPKLLQQMFDPYSFDQSTTQVLVASSNTTATNRSQKHERPTEKSSSENVSTKINKSDLLLSPFGRNQLFEQLNVNQSDEDFDDTVTTSTVRSQLIIGVSPDGRRGQLLLLQQSTRLANPLMNMSNNDMMRMLQASDDEDDDDDDDFIGGKKVYSEVMRLKTEGKSNEEIRHHLEDIHFENSLKKAIDASLKTSKSTENQSFEQPKSNPPIETNPSLITVKEITQQEPEIIPLPSSLLKSPEPIVPSPTILETATNSSPPITETKPDPSASLTVEELRQRYLQSSGRKNRSIISNYVPSDDEIST